MVAVLIQYSHKLGQVSEENLQKLLETLPGELQMKLFGIEPVSLLLFDWLAIWSYTTNKHRSITMSITIMVAHKNFFY